MGWADKNERTKRAREGRDEQKRQEIDKDPRETETIRKTRERKRRVA